MPGPEIELPGPRLSEAAGSAAAETAARRAVIAYMSGDSAGLKAVASRRSSQLAECTHPTTWMRMKAQAGAVELRGNERLAVGLVESTFEGDRFLGGDPIAVVLVREDGDWKVLIICRDVVTVKDAVPALCGMMARLDGSTSDPPEPRLVEPREGQNVGEEHPYLTWTVDPGGGPLLAQVFAYQYGDFGEKEASWPEAQAESVSRRAPARQGRGPGGNRGTPHELVRLDHRPGRAGRGGARGALRSGTSYEESSRCRVTIRDGLLKQRS